MKTVTYGQNQGHCAQWSRKNPLLAHKPVLLYRCYMSPDGNHDEAFWQYCADDTIKFYKAELEKRGIKLKHVHVW